MQFSASEKKDGGGEERDWERKEYKVKDEDGRRRKMERKMRMYIVYCILKFRHKIVAHVCVQGNTY